MRFNFKLIVHLMGILLLCNGGFMAIATSVSGAHHDGVTLPMFYAAFCTLILGLAAVLLTRRHSKELKRKEGYIIVTFGWLIMSVSGALPYLFTGSLPTVTDAIFETISGYTTTGASVIGNLETLPEGILFWRSLTQWIGGMGIIVLAIAILPLLGIGGMQLFAAEAPGPEADKLHPRITDTAKRLWAIYVGYTAAEALLLWVAGMTVFDAVNHSLTTLSTGGFSTKNASLAFWNDRPIIQYIITLFMILAGTNFVLSYFAFKGKVQKVIMNEEWKYYMLLLLGFTGIVASVVFYEANVPVSDYFPQVYGEAESAIRHGLFQVVSVVTTTGFVSADFTNWTPFLTVFFFGLMFCGGSAGSTSGGIKVMRHVMIIKNGLLEFRRNLHPNAVLPVRFNNKVISEQIVFNIVAFFVLYMLLFIIGGLVLSAMGLDFETAIGTAASSLGNVGPAFGSLSPLNTFSGLPELGKWWCGFLMLAGRLELFTVLILLNPEFWRRRS